MEEDYGYPYGLAHPHSPVFAEEDPGLDFSSYYTYDWYDAEPEFDDWYDVDSDYEPWYGELDAEDIIRDDDYFEDDY